MVSMLMINIIVIIYHWVSIKFVPNNIVLDSFYVKHQVLSVYYRLLPNDEFQFEYMNGLRSTLHNLV